MDALIGQQIDNYKVIKFIARGGMADVYLAEDTQLERQVVLKIILSHIADTAEIIARFQREARATARLQHPNIVQVYSIGNTPDGRAYIAMQYISGGALSDRLQQLIEQDQWVTPTYALSLMRQMADALTAAHGAGIVHRDMKPSNILLRSNGTAVLSDLGIAVVQQATTRLTRTGGILGTPHYMSPEQAAGQPVDGRSDLYSLGIILYELLYGQPPFMADSPLAIVHHQLYEQPAPLEQRRPGLAAATYQVVKTCLHKDPNARYQSAADLLVALDRAIKAEGGTAVSPTIVDMPAYATTEQLSIPAYTPPQTAKPTKNSRFFLWSLIPLILLILLFFAWRSFWVAPPPITVTEVPPNATAVTKTVPTETAAAVIQLPTETQTPEPSQPEITPTPTALPPTNTPTPTAPGIQPLHGSGVIRMTQNVGSQQFAPILSPDQKTLTFMSDRSGEWRVYTMDTLGGSWQEAIPNTQSYHGHFSPDSRELVLTAKQDGNWDIYSTPINGGSPLKLTTRATDEVYPSYSLDGEWIVYMLLNDNQYDIYRMRADGSDDQAVLNSSANETFPVFAPNGRFILFQSNKDGSHNIYTIPVAGGTPRQITFSSARDANPVYSPDGEWIAFETDRDGNYEIYLMRSDGSDLHNVTNHTARDQLPAFSPDGQWLLFQSNRNGNTEIYRQSIDIIR